MSSDTHKTDGAAAVLMTVQQFLEALDAISCEHGRAENFRHFMEAAYCSLAKVTASDAKRAEALEARYRAVVRAYESKREIMVRMSQLLGRLIITVAHYRGDFLGEACTRGALTNDRLNPRIATYVVAEQELRTCLQPREVAALLSKGRPISLHEPACGAGARILATAAHLESMGFDPRRTLFATLIDIDPLAYQMAFLQMTFKGIPALCICADTVTMQEFDRACTAAAIHQRQWLAARGEHSAPLLGPCAPGQAASSQSDSTRPDEGAAQRAHLRQSARTPASRTRSRRTRPH